MGVLFPIYILNKRVVTITVDRFNEIRAVDETAVVIVYKRYSVWTYARSCSIGMGSPSLRVPL